MELAGEEVMATAERALIWPRERTVFVADIHFGKDATLRRANRWVPFGTTTHDLARLSLLLRKYEANRLIILGDAFHSEHAEEKETREEIAAWRKDHTETEMLMIAGNHDRRAKTLAADLGFQVEEENYRLGPWMLRHHPPVEADEYTLCGHLHPQAILTGEARQSLRVACFWFRKDYAVLPAFGGFTGGSAVRPRAEDRVILIADRKLSPI